MSDVVDLFFDRVVTDDFQRMLVVWVARRAAVIAALLAVHQLRTTDTDAELSEQVTLAGENRIDMSHCLLCSGEQ